MTHTEQRSTATTLRVLAVLWLGFVAAGCGRSTEPVEIRDTRPPERRAPVPAGLSTAERFGLRHDASPADSSGTGGAR